MPPAFFLTPILPIEFERTTKWRSNTTATKFARDRAESRYEWLREIVDYFSGYFDMPALNIPTIKLPEDFREITHEMIDAAASECRNFWGLGSLPVPNLVLLLENNGVIVSRGKLNADGLDAFSEWLPQDYPYVFLGSDINVCVRSRFDASHELGHLILHRAVTKKQYGKPEDFKLLEKQAHRFAAAFLLPKDQFFKELWAPTLDAFASLKCRWKASIKGMIVHSHRYGLLSDTQYQRTMINYNRRWKNGEPLDDSLPVESPRLLMRCAEMLVSEGIKSKEQIACDLPFSAHDIEELVGLPNGYLANKQAEVISLPTPQIKDRGTMRSDTVILPFNRFK